MKRNAELIRVMHIAEETVEKTDLLISTLKDKEIVWKKGKWAGRKARIFSADWQVKKSGGTVIFVSVDTMRSDNEGYMTSLDKFHTTSYDVDLYFEEFKF